VLVLEHAGACLPRQYRTFAGVAHGRHTHRFFEKLIGGGFATTDLAAPAHGGRIYHLQYKPWYRALGEADYRHRKPVSVGRAVERLMVLDGVLAEPDVTWLGLVWRQGRGLHERALVRAAGRAAPDDGRRRRAPVPGPPVGLVPDGSCLFLYLVTTPFPTTFRTFLRRHLALLSALPSWRLRLLVPPALSDARDAHIRTVHQVLDPVVGNVVDTRLDIVPVTQSYLRLERLVGTA